LAGLRARGIVRAGLGGLILQRIEIEHFAIGVDRRDAVFVRLDLQIRERVETLLHADQRIAERGTPARSVAGQRVKNAPVIVHVFIARFAVGVARERHVRAVGKHLQQLVAQRFVVQGEKRPGAQPGALKRDQVDVEVAALGERATLRLREASEALVFLRAAGDGRADLVRGVRIGRAQPRLMDFHIPLDVRIFVRVVGPRRSFQFEAADDGDDFLAVGHAQAGLRRGHGDGFGRDEVFFGEQGATLRAGAGRGLML